MKDVSRLFSEETKIVFKDGSVIEGSEKVANLILKCCDAYNKGYLGAMVKPAVIGVVVISVVSFGIGYNFGKESK
jgi:hypothetical protein